MDSPKQNKSVGVIILAAGASSRMGKPKMLLPWRGTTVIGHVISQWRELGAGQIAVVHRTNDAKLLEALNTIHGNDACSLFPPERGEGEYSVVKQSNDSTIQLITNPQPERGMFSSILCAADWNGWKRGISHWAIALGDQPHLHLETFDALLKCSSQNPAVICQPVNQNKAGHPVILPQSIFRELKETRAETLKDFLKPFSAQTVYCSVADAGLSFDMDTPEDYKKALELDA